MQKERKKKSWYFVNRKKEIKRGFILKPEE
jgi:hypothetical protein